MNDESMFYKKLIDKHVRLIKLVNGKDFFYNGTIVEVFNDKLVIDDKKVGKTIISFTSISSCEENVRSDACD